MARMEVQLTLLVTGGKNPYEVVKEIEKMEDIYVQETEIRFDSGYDDFAPMGGEYVLGPKEQGKLKEIFEKVPDKETAVIEIKGEDIEKAVKQYKARKPKEKAVVLPPKAPEIRLHLR